ncbi:pyridoxamine 5'-phosphate oxidase family protein [Natrinema sp. 74]|uniref:pyridoxamine 5'-phosphate oxidase family protein n=1 Tax=Natrinema sp. 74 TaxID=3384159 RepID=UPI0038D45E67
MSVDELQAYGLEKMNDTEIRSFLSTQNTGVLGLPEEDAPYLLPLTYGYDGETRLYFTFLLGTSSRKRALSQAADTASFLVFKVDTMYNWESTLLRGSITEVSETEWDSLEEVLSETWRPELFDTVTLSGEVSVYEFEIDEQTGIKHQGLPPAFQTTDESQ